MNFNITEHLPTGFHPSSRVWIYQSSRLFTIAEALDLEQLINDFVAEWQSHGAKVKGFATLFFGQFIILIADESNASVSGCSTDSSVRLIKQVEQQFDVDLFNRQTLAFLVKDKVQLLPLSQLNYALENQFITTDTTYFNNLVLTLKELTEQWMIPVKDSWLMKKVKVQVQA